MLQLHTFGVGHSIRNMILGPPRRPKRGSNQPMIVSLVCVSFNNYILCDDAVSMLQE